MSRTSQIGRWAPDVVSKVDSLASLPPATGSGRKVSVTGYHVGTTVGGGEVVDTGLARHDGVIYFDPNRVGEIGTAAYYVDSGVDANCWGRVGVDVVTAEMAGSGSGIDSESIAAAYAIADKVAITKPLTISSDLAVAADKEIVFNGGYLIITGSAVVTIDALIVANEEYIFRGTGNVQATNMYQNNYPSNAFNKNSKIYAKWFGVLNDAEVKTYYSPAGEPADSTVFGTAPVGTDSTTATQQAILYCEQASRKVDTFSYSDNSPELILPTGAIYVSGDNPFGAQLLKTQVEAAYADADLGNIPTLSDELRFSAHKIRITGQDTVVFWKPLTTDDKFLNAYFYIDGLWLKDFTVLPLVPEGEHWGTFIYNLALGPRGSTSNYRNSLTKIFLDNVRCMMSANDGRDAMTSDKYSSINTILHLEGYARADQINFTNCHFRAFITAIKNENPEAICHNYINTWFIPTTLFPSEEKCIFYFSSFFGGFEATGCYFGLKGSNVRLLKTEYRTDNYIGNSQFADVTFHLENGNRMEGGTGETDLVLYEGYQGTAIFSGFNVSFGGSHSAAIDAVLTNRAKAVFKNGQYFGRYTLDESLQTFESPVQYKNANFALSLPTNGGTYGTSTYFFTVIANADNKIPSVSFENCTPLTWLPIPKYYGSTHNELRQLTYGTIADTAGTSRLRIGQSSVSNPFDDVKTIPSNVVLESLRFSLSSHPTSAFDGLRLTFTNDSGSYVIDTVLTGSTVADQDIMPAGKWISTGREVTTITAELTKAGAPVAGSHPGSIEIGYRPMIRSSDVLTTSTYLPHEITQVYY